MKRTILALIVTLFIAAPAMAADVVISITIPDAYVARLQAAVGSLNCETDEGTLTPKECLKAKMIRELIDFVNRYEEKTATDVAQQAYNEALQEYQATHVPIAVE